MSLVNRLDNRVLQYVGYRLPIVAIVVLFYLPLLSIVVFSFWERSGLWMDPAFQLDAYARVANSASLFAKSIGMGVLTGTIALLIAFPVAYYLTYSVTDFQKTVLLSIFAIPFFVSEFVRIVMLSQILSDSGVLNTALQSAGIVSEPVRILHTDVAIVIGTLLSFMPFVIFTGWLSMEMINRELIDASYDLGAKRFTSIRTVIAPLALPGLSVGVMFVVAAGMGSAIYPLVLGGTDAVSIGLMVQRSYNTLDIPRASAIMVITTGIYIVSLLVISRYVDINKMFETVGGE